jgi:ubiquinone/menaquinone biosynthesis C-methylase UbiE
VEHDKRKEFIRTVFDTICDGYGEGSLRFFENAAEKLPDLLNLKGNENVLDVASGTGLASTRLATRLPGGHVTGIDLSEGMLSKARSLATAAGLTNIEFRQMDMMQMDLPEDHYDVVNSSFGVFFVEDMQQLVKHIATRLKPGGRFITTHFAKGSMSPMQELIMQRLQNYDVEVPQASWNRLDNEVLNRELYESAGLANITHTRNQVGYYFKDANDWWDVVWWAGFRGFVNQVPEARAEQFKQEHLEEVNALADEQGVFFNVDVIHTIGEKV